MARIRSIHPGLYTDEAFMDLSMAARVFLPGLWTEADDHGVFEWKPRTLKAKILPADDVDAAALLDELVAAKFITRFESEGTAYGAVRNFMVYQSPRRPNTPHPFPDTLKQWVGFGKKKRGNDDGGSPPIQTPAPLPTPSSCDARTLSEQGGDERRGVLPGEGVGEGEEVDDGGEAPERVKFDANTEAVITAADADPAKQARWMTASATVAKWLARGAVLDLDVLPAIRAVMVQRRGQGPPDGPEYFTRAVLEAMERRLRPLPDVTPIPSNGGQRHASRDDRDTARRDALDRGLADAALRRMAPG